jgi:excinuclease ABC subunit C
MEELFARPQFSGFGPGFFTAASHPPSLHQVHGRRSCILRAAVRQDCPRQPGVYGMVDPAGKLIYVGKARSLRVRLLSYFRPKSRDPRAGRILAQAQTIVWECLPSEFAALLRELELIRRWRPRFNKQGQPHRRRLTYVCLGRRPVPHVFLSAWPANSVLACLGPVPAGDRARSAVRCLNDGLGLRDCPRKQVMIFADQVELFPLHRGAGCIRHEIGTCLGPCVAACSQADYGQRVRAAGAFLEGRDNSLLTALERDMATAAAAQVFERAAVLRDKLEALHWLRERLERLERAREDHTFVYPVRGLDGNEAWYLIHQGRVKAALPAPRSSAAARSATEALDAVFGRPAAANAALAAHEFDGVLLVAAWFRKHPEERARTLTPWQALDLCAAHSPVTSLGPASLPYPQ